jgi:hypothetical protein
MKTKNSLLYVQLTDGSIIFTKFLSKVHILKLSVDTKSHKLWRSLFLNKEILKINEKRIILFNNKFFKNEQIRVTAKLHY